MLIAGEALRELETGETKSNSTELVAETKALRTFLREFEMRRLKDLALFEIMYIMIGSTF